MIKGQRDQRFENPGGRIFCNQNERDFDMDAAQGKSEAEGSRSLMKNPGGRKTQRGSELRLAALEDLKTST